jgi:hypothetical protein
MTSLAEDVKLSACGRHPSLFLHVDFVCLFLFFRLSVCHPSLGELLLRLTSLATSLWYCIFGHIGDIVPY